MLELSGYELPFHSPSSTRQRRVRIPGSSYMEFPDIFDHNSYLSLKCSWDRRIPGSFELLNNRLKNFRITKSWNLFKNRRRTHWRSDLRMVRSDTNDGIWKPDRWGCSILPPRATLVLLVSLSNQVKGEKSRHIELQCSLLKNKDSLSTCIKLEHLNSTISLRNLKHIHKS